MPQDTKLVRRGNLYTYCCDVECHSVQWARKRRMLTVQAAKKKKTKKRLS